MQSSRVNPTAQLAPGVEFLRGPVNGVRLRAGAKSIAIYGDSRDQPEPADLVLLTHYRREVTWAAGKLLDQGSRAVIPFSETRFLQSTPEVWRDYTETLRYHDYDNQVSRYPRSAISRPRGVLDGDRIEWEGYLLRVAATPGYTRGGVSYLLEAGGKRFAFTGDLIYGEGQLVDLYSLQDSIPELKVRGYHGYAARASELIQSLRDIMAWNPDVVVPARGGLITKPSQAISLLISRLESVYENYLYTDAYRWYFGDDNYRARAARVLGSRAPKWMPQAVITSEEPFPWMRQVQNSRLITSQDGAAMLVDCGSRRVADQVRQWRADGVFRKLEGIYITHYHDDHTDFAQRTAEEFDCPVYSCRSMKEILTQPDRFRMPCLTPNPITRWEEMPSGEARNWHEYRLTCWDFPGQTLYHGLLLVEKRDAEKVLFVGDSFTPTGQDDYCLLNRNPVHPSKGFSRCLQLLKRMPREAHWTNQHVKPMFRFTLEQIEELERSLARRRQLLREMLPWDDADFGVDEQWARLDPYYSEARAGDTIQLALHFVNYSGRPQRFSASLTLPSSFPAVAEGSINLGPGSEGAVRFRVKAPDEAQKLHLITANVRFGEHDLREWAEALVRIS